MTKEEFIRAMKHGKNSPVIHIMVAIYKNSSDYVAKAHFVTRGKHVVSDSVFYSSNSLDDVRDTVLRVMNPVNIPKILSNDKSIVEMYE